MNEAEAPTDPAHSQRTVSHAVLVLVIVMLLADLAIIPFLEWVEGINPNQDWAMFFAAAMAGLIASQLFLFVTYAALGDGSSPRRVIYTTFVLALFTNVLVLFCRSWFQVTWSEVVLVFLVPMLVFFLLQIPLWGVRSCFGWTIRSPWSETNEPVRLRFSLAHVLGWSVFLAVPLCILQALMTGSSGPIGAGPVIVCFCAVPVCLLLLGILYLALATNLGLGQSMMLGMLVMLAVAVTEVTGISLWLGSPGQELWHVIMMFFTLHCSAGAVLLLCFRLARRLGFRLLPFAASGSRQSAAGLSHG